MQPSMHASEHGLLYKLTILLLVTVPLLAMMYAVYLLWNRAVFWSDLALLGVMYFFVGVGVTIGYHRMLTHEGFKTSSMLRGLFLILGTMGFEGGPMDWAARHIQHHAHSDEEGDPHSPLDGFWHAHMGWLWSEPNPDVPRYAPHLLQDPVAQFVQKYTVLWMALSLAVPFLIGGWTGLLWGGAVRVFLLTHATWSVNSICHTFGRREFETTDESRNEWIVGLLAMGEGWHNNHHAFPRSAFHGLHWWQFDLSGLVIRALEKLGFVWEVQRVSSESMTAQRIRSRTMHESMQKLRDDLWAKIAGAQAELARMLDHKVQATIDEARLMEITSSCEDAAKRLEQIQTAVTRTTHLKKQKLLLYGAEVQQLVQKLKEQTTPAAI